MLAQNSQGLSVSAVPTAAEVEDLPQPQHYGYKSQGAAVNEEACRYEEEQQQEEEGEEEEEECIREEGGIEEAVSIMKVESTTDEKKPLNTSDLALESVEKYEQLRLHGFIDRRYHYNITRDANSLSTGRNTTSTEPGSAGQASPDYVMSADFIKFVEDMWPLDERLKTL